MCMGVLLYVIQAVNVTSTVDSLHLTCTVYSLLPRVPDKKCRNFTFEVSGRCSDMECTGHYDGKHFEVYLQSTV